MALFKNPPFHVLTSGGQTTPQLFTEPSPTTSRPLIVVALGHFGKLGMCWLLFSSAFFLTGGFEATQINKSLHSELKTAFPRPSSSEPLRCLSINRRDVQLRDRQTRLVMSSEGDGIPVCKRNMATMRWRRRSTNLPHAGAPSCT